MTVVIWLMGFLMGSLFTAVECSSVANRLKQMCSDLLTRKYIFTAKHQSSEKLDKEISMWEIKIKHLNHVAMLLYVMSGIFFICAFKIMWDLVVQGKLG